ncbi:hypothetical protein HQN60_09685 [Deefgea piscis]|uniref:Uncharacterized protein n=1 Tax=Deefgea piscis TaxID=2739061 RepID=A0A6M8SNZ2_9NEIS|nr:hypothetical protein [Deefgea piscis]QKJ66943.1 hypothetical protein HQN60_09685 [Deefgea piscis]
MTKPANPVPASEKEPKNAVENLATPAPAAAPTTAPKTNTSTARKPTTRRARTAPAKTTTETTVAAQASTIASPAPSVAKASPAAATKTVARKPAVTKTAASKTAAAKPTAAKFDSAKADAVKASSVADVPMAKVSSKRKAAASVDDLETLATHLLSEQSSAAPQAKMGKKLDKASQLPAKKSAKKAKLIRDSFTFPESDYALIAALKQRVISAGLEVKKSELIRAGLNALSALADEELHKMLQQLEKIKTGRPAK